MKRIAVLLGILLTASLGDADTHYLLSNQTVGNINVPTPVQLITSSQPYALPAYLSGFRAGFKPFVALPTSNVAIRHDNGIFVASLASGDPQSLSGINSFGQHISTSNTTVTGLSGNAKDAGGTGSSSGSSNSAGFAVPKGRANGGSGITPASPTKTPSHSGNGSGGGLPFNGGNHSDIQSAPEIDTKPARLALGLLSGMMLLIIEHKKYSTMNNRV